MASRVCLFVTMWRTLGVVRRRCGRSIAPCPKAADAEVKQKKSCMDNAPRRTHSTRACLLFLQFIPHVSSTKRDLLFYFIHAVVSLLIVIPLSLSNHQYHGEDAAFQVMGSGVLWIDAARAAGRAEIPPRLS